jgi:hypothetical protein
MLDANNITLFEADLSSDGCPAWGGGHALVTLTGDHGVCGGLAYQKRLVQVRKLRAEAQ